jgi:beta-lactamase class A
MEMNRVQPMTQSQTSRNKWLIFSLICVAVLMLAAILYLRLQPTPIEPDTLQPTQPSAQDEAAYLPVGPLPPARFAAQIKALGQGFSGRVGITVQSVDAGWTADFRGGGLFPQQSVSKLWVAASVLDQIDRGMLHLDDPITLTRADLTIFHQPIRARIGEGSYTTDIAELLRFAMTQSDNTANDVLFRRVGGQDGMQRFLVRKKIDEIAMGPGEKLLQTKTAGMTWDDRFSTGKTFWQVRETVPIALRTKALAAYVASPPDAATPVAIANGLSRLARGELLSRASSAYLIALMNQSKTGPDRLKSGLSTGWSLAHKTGTGQVLGNFATGYNDVGILSAPSGQTYAVVVMIASTRATIKERQALMGAVTRAVIACDASRAC